MTSPQTVAEVLDAAADLLTPEGAWTQGSYARGKSGREVETRRAATCFCVLGAISYVHGAAPSEEYVSPKEARAVRAAAGLPEFGSLADWNDDLARTQPEVVATLRRAAALARAEKAHV